MSTRTDGLQHFSRAGLTFDVRDDGPRDGEVVLLLHGFPQDGSAWDAVAPRLVAAGLRTLAPDQRGYSPGARPRAVGDYRMTELVADALALADAAGAERVHVVGHDWGGAVAWAVAMRAPERVATLTVLSTPHPTAFGRALRTPEQARKSWYMGVFQLPALPERLLARGLGLFLRYGGLPQPWRGRYVERFTTAESLRGPIAWYRAGARGGLGGGARDRITVPTTYLWGARDVALGRTPAEESGNHVDADYRFVEVDGGHWLPELHPDEAADAVLDRIARGSAPA